MHNIQHTYVGRTLERHGVVVGESELPPQYDRIIEQHTLILHDGLRKNLAGGDPDAMLGDLFHNHTWHAPSGGA
jgi:hypothetical protein